MAARVEADDALREGEVAHELEAAHAGDPDLDHARHFLLGGLQGGRRRAVPPLVHHELALDDGIQVAVEHHDSRAVADLGACRDEEVQLLDALARVVD